MAPGWNRTLTTLVGEERSHHSTIPPRQHLSRPRILIHRVKLTFSLNIFIWFEFYVNTAAQRPLSLLSFYHISSYLERLTMWQSQCMQFHLFQFPSKSKLKHFSNAKFYPIKKAQLGKPPKRSFGKIYVQAIFSSEFYGTRSCVDSDTKPLTWSFMRSSLQQQQLHSVRLPGVPTLRWVAR